MSAKYKKRFSEAERLVIEATIDKWLANNIIEPCTHPRPIVNNLLTVPKPDGTFRVCIDATIVNQATPGDPTFTPDMRAVLESMVGSNWISVFDLFSGYLQVSFREEDRHKLAFSSRLGLF